MENNNNTPFHGEDEKRARINKLKQDIEMVSQNLFGFYEHPSGELQGHDIKFNNLNMIAAIINSNLNDKERETIKVFSKLIQDHKMLKPLYTIKLNQGFKENPTKRFNEDNGKSLASLLLNFQVFIYDLDEKYSGDVKGKNIQKQE